jgi:hypothetical protein
MISFRYGLFTGAISLCSIIFLNCDSRGPSASSERLQSLGSIKLTEIQYHPSSSSDSVDADQYEFIELKNTGTSTVDMSGAGFTDGIKYSFPADVNIAPQAFFVIAADSVKFKARYGFAPDDVYGGKLSNDGEKISLTDLQTGSIVFSITYSDTIPWPLEADGRGYTLVPVSVNPDGDQNSAAQWRISTDKKGSPGKDD